ncbi:hypothetical protein [Altericista sp. CCNU0014]|uniref:hypothetical protein n=1 Tax=Altericista sp. CCNU0014 TaxID=3082949 RepID=UPI00384DE920
MTATPIRPNDTRTAFLESLTAEQRDRAIAMLNEWMHDKSGYDEAAWPELKEALNRERDAVGARRLFID